MKIKSIYESPKLELLAMLSKSNIANITASTIEDPNPDVDPETPDVDVD